MNTPVQIRLLVELALILALSLTAPDAGALESPMNTSQQTKAQILALANQFKGEGDPDLSKQRALDVLVERLIKLAPQLPLKQRLPLVAGAWYQVWGAYAYGRSASRSVDPELDVNQLYQVISSEGYYYNISVLRKLSDPRDIRVGLLRGEYQLDPTKANGLTVHFTRYPGTIPAQSSPVPIWQLAELAEMDRLPNKISIVPTWIVRLFFRGGALEEVYTDADLRICYGTRQGSNATRQLFILTRAH